MLRKIIDKTLDVSLVIILGTMASIVAANVFCRFLLGFSIYWGDELALVLMVWLTFLGAAVAIRDNAHYTFSYLAGKLNGSALRNYLLLRNLLVITSILILGYHSFQITRGITSWILPALEISRAYVYVSAPLGCLFMLYYSVDQLLIDLKQNHKATNQ